MTRQAVIHHSVNLYSIILTVKSKRHIDRPIYYRLNATHVQMVFSLLFIKLINYVRIYRDLSVECLAISIPLAYVSFFVLGTKKMASLLLFCDPLLSSNPPLLLVENIYYS